MRSELHIKIVIIASVFLFGFVIFKSLQNDYIFQNTLGKIAVTYENHSKAETYNKNIDIVKTDKSYTSLDESNFIHWDVKFFKFMADNSYGKDDTWPGVGTYAFSPLFPFIWKLSHLPARYISILNYLMFALSILILSDLFLSTKDFNKIDRLLLFTFALTLPFVFSFYIPYCESTFLFTMSIALWGLFNKKFWLFFIGLIFFSLSRPSFLIVGLAFIATDLYFLILNKNFKLFLKELGIKLLPIIIGMLITFFIQYLNSGNFFKMFEVHSKFWDHNFQYPRTLSDWSGEGYGMNIFSIFSIVFPSGLLLFIYLLKNHETKLNPPVSFFAEETRIQYLFSLAIVYFAGNFLFVFLTQGGNLNGLHRYVLASPFFYVFLFILASKIKTIDFKYLLIVLIPMVYLGYILLVHGPYMHVISFLDMGYFLLVLSMMYFVLFNRMKTPIKIGTLFILIFFNTVWLTYIFNAFLNNSFIVA